MLCVRFAACAGCRQAARCDAPPRESTSPACCVLPPDAGPSCWRTRCPAAALPPSRKRWNCGLPSRCPAGASWRAPAPSAAATTRCESAPPSCACTRWRASCCRRWCAPGGGAGNGAGAATAGRALVLPLRWLSALARPRGCRFLAAGGGATGAAHAPSPRAQRWATGGSSSDSVRLAAAGCGGPAAAGKGRPGAAGDRCGHTPRALGPGLLAGAGQPLDARSGAGRVTAAPPASSC